MKPILSVIVYSTLLLFLANCQSCHKPDVIEDAKKNKMDMKEFEEDVVIPPLVWKAIESNYRPMALDPEGEAIKKSKEEGEGKTAETKPASKKNGKAEDSEISELLKKRPPVVPVSFHVYLVEKSPGVLGGQNYDLKFPPGGGVIDYRYFLPENKDGTFYFKIKYDEELSPKDTKIYYLSNAKIRDLEGKSVGNGCGRYFDISDYWNTTMNSEGLVLNTVGQRHVSVTSGTFFIVEPYRGKLRLAHLTVRDSRHRNLLCETDSAKE